MSNTTILSINSGHTCGLINSTSGVHRNLRIMISSNAQYLTVVFNWLIYFNRVCSDSSRGLIYFLCLDKATEVAMRNHGLYCSHVSNGLSHAQLWSTRVIQTKQLLDQGYDVLLSDADAIWLRNPFEVLEAFPNSDVIGSRASFPAEAFQKLGATICMGFIYIKSTHGSRALWGQLVTAVEKMKAPDDQKAINLLFKDFGLEFQPHPSFPDNGGPPSTGTMTFDQRQGKSRLKKAADEMKDLVNVSVTLLPHNLFRRVCMEVPVKTILNSVVAHCYIEKTGKSKERGEKFYGLWRIRNDWNRFSFNESTDNVEEFLRKIDTQQD